MRITLTLGPKVAAMAKAAAAEQKKSINAVINEALRTEFNRRRKVANARPYRTVPHRLGLRDGLNYDNVSELLAVTEGDRYK